MITRSPKTNRPKHLLVFGGQSNMTGNGNLGDLDAVLDAGHERVFQYVPLVGSIYNDTIQPTVSVGEPVRHAGGGGGIGPALTIAKAYAQDHPEVDVLIVPCAWAASGFGGGSVGTGRWNAAMAAAAGEQDNAALMVGFVNRALQLAGPGSKVVGMFWHQGEGDQTAAALAAAGQPFATTLDAFVDFCRNNLVAEKGVAGTAINLPFVCGGLAPERFTALSSGDKPAAQAVQDALSGLPKRKKYTGFAPAPSGMLADTSTHFNGEAQRIMGRRMYDAFRRAVNNGNKTVDAQGETRYVYPFANGDSATAWAEHARYFSSAAIEGRVVYLDGPNPHTHKKNPQMPMGLTKRLVTEGAHEGVTVQLTATGFGWTPARTADYQWCQNWTIRNLTIDRRWYAGRSDPTIFGCRIDGAILQRVHFADYVIENVRTINVPETEYWIGTADLTNGTNVLSNIVKTKGSPARGQVITGVAGIVDGTKIIDYDPVANSATIGTLGSSRAADVAVNATATANRAFSLVDGTGPPCPNVWIENQDIGVAHGVSNGDTTSGSPLIINYVNAAALVDDVLSGAGIASGAVIVGKKDGAGVVTGVMLGGDPNNSIRMSSNASSTNVGAAITVTSFANNPIMWHTDGVVRGCQLHGGDFGVAMVAGPGTSSALRGNNGYFQNVGIEDCKHWIKDSTTTFQAQACFFLVGGGWGGRIWIKNCYGENCNDVGTETDGASDVLVRDVVLVNCSTGFFFKNFHKAGRLNLAGTDFGGEDPASQFMVFDNCDEYKNANWKRVGASLKAYGNSSSSNTMGHLVLRNCRALHDGLSLTNITGATGMQLLFQQGVHSVSIEGRSSFETRNMTLDTNGGLTQLRQAYLASTYVGAHYFVDPKTRLVLYGSRTATVGMTFRHLSINGAGFTFEGGVRSRFNFGGYVLRGTATNGSTDITGVVVDQGAADGTLVGKVIQGTSSTHFAAGTTITGYRDNAGNVFGVDPGANNVIRASAAFGGTTGAIVFGPWLGSATVQIMVGEDTGSVCAGGVFEKSKAVETIGDPNPSGIRFGNTSNGTLAVQGALFIDRNDWSLWNAYNTTAVTGGLLTGIGSEVVFDDGAVATTAKRLVKWGKNGWRGWTTNPEWWTATVDPASILTGTSVVNNVSIGGVSLGTGQEMVEGKHASQANHLLVWAWVNGTDQAALQIANFSGGTIDPASGTARVRKVSA